MDHAPDCAARWTNPSAQPWRVERRKRYGAIWVRINAAVFAYDDAWGPYKSEHDHEQRPTKSLVAGVDRDKIRCLHLRFSAFFWRCRTLDSRYWILDSKCSIKEEP